MNRQLQKINIANADKIGFIGDSYTESHFSVEGKAYICKLSLFSDYNYENFAKSGDTYRGNLDRLRKELPIYHDVLSWKDIKPKYAFLVSYTNDLKYMDEAQYLNDLRAMIETVKGLGALPIIATEYHANFGPGLQIGLRQLAYEYDCDLVDILDEVKAVRGIDYEPFWSGTHPGTRSNHLMGDQFEYYLDQLPRPRQSLKLFRARDNYHDLDELIFNTNEERAKLFKEINVGHNALVDPKQVDRVTTAPHEKIVSEYLELQNGKPVTFKDWALISAVLPSSALGIDYLALDLGDLEAEVYVKDIVALPYPTPTFYQRFDIEEEHGIEVGDTYISDNPHFKDVIFTIEEVSEDGVLALPYPRIATNISGHLIKVGGKGPDKVFYPYTAIGFSDDYPEGKPQVGHYVKIGRESGKYVVPTHLIGQCMDYDKVHFIVKKQGNFSISELNVEWCGVENKVYKSKSLQGKSFKGKELLVEDKGQQQLLSCIPDDKCLPKPCDHCIALEEDDFISKQVYFKSEEITREALVEVIARYFPKVYDPEEDYDQCEITLDSYDFGKVSIACIFEGKAFKQEQRVGLHWKRLQFPIILPADVEQFELRIYAKDKKLQIAKVSVVSDFEDNI